MEKEVNSKVQRNVELVGRKRTITSNLNVIMEEMLEWGIDPSWIIDAVKYAQTFTTDISPFDPESLYGSILRGKSIGQFLKILNINGSEWVRDNGSNQHRIVNLKAGKALVFQLGNDLTGVISSISPRTKWEKGADSKQLAQANQLTFGDYSIEADADMVFVENPIQTFFVLIFPDEKADEIRIEVSLPRYLDANGKIYDYDPRYILTPVPIGGLEIDLSDLPVEISEEEIIVESIL